MKSRSSWVAIMFANLAYINAQLTHAHSLRCLEGIAPFRRNSWSSPNSVTASAAADCEQVSVAAAFVYCTINWRYKSNRAFVLYCRVNNKHECSLSLTLTHPHAFICRAYAVLGTRAQRTCNCYVTVDWALLLHTPENCKQRLVKSCQVALEW